MNDPKRTYYFAAIEDLESGQKNRLLQNLYLLALELFLLATRWLMSTRLQDSDCSTEICSTRIPPGPQ